MTLLDIWSLIEYVKGDICAALEVFFAMSSAQGCGSNRPLAPSGLVCCHNLSGFYPRAAPFGLRNRICGLGHTAF